MSATSFSMLSDGTQFRLQDDSSADIFTKSGRKGLRNGHKHQDIKVAPSTPVYTL